ncbi:hypothetical protein ATANTOWER_027779, partial [Ataeniobius toweri]|nr:hypothetical protein [Ataeniobius toweri]
KTTTPSPKTTGSPSLSFNYMLPSLASISGVVFVLLVLLVLLVRRRIHRRSEIEEKEAGEDSIIYSDVRITEHHQTKKQLSKESDPAAIYSALRTEDINYGQIVIKSKKQKSKPGGSDPAAVYSAVRTEDVS